jgi:ATP-dependent helicase/nuclease subunit B
MPKSPTPDRLCEFWIGRAGAGKTHGCLRAIADELIRAPRGAPLLLLVPEQATAQLERRLATWPGVLGGFTRARVVSFRHLRKLASDDAATTAGAAPPPPAVGETGRVMLLRRAIRACREKLHVFAASAAQPGLADRLARTLDELQQYAWTPDRIDAWLAALPKVDRTTHPTARKLSDLLIIWRAYDAQLERGGWGDATAHHAATLAAIRQWPALEGCRLWIDGFSSLTALEHDLLEALLSRAAAAVVALCANPVAASSTRPRVGPERLFENAEATLIDLERRLNAVGWRTRRVALPREGDPTRFDDAPALAHLESRVLGRLHPLRFDSPTDGAIELIEAADRRAEVEAVARRIVTLCRRPESPPQSYDPTPSPLLWREVGVLARDLEPYAALVREVFARFEIPRFLDRRREMTGHPIARLLLTSLAALRADRAGRRVIHHLKCGLGGLRDPDAVARLENHILGTDPDGRGWLEIADAHPDLAAGRDAALAPLDALERALRDGAHPARALWALLQQVDAAAILQQWIADAQAAGDEDAAQFHDQAWNLTLDWLEELERLSAADRELLAPPSDHHAWLDLLDELTALVESALATIRARLIPPTLNQVTVGAVDRSRTPDVHTLFVLGMNEGEMPRLWTPDAILGDGDRERLASDAGRALGPDATARRLQEHYLTYIALTRPGRRLTLCRPLSGDDGKPTHASSVFKDVADAFKDAPRRVVGNNGRDEDPALGLLSEESALHLIDAVDRLGSPQSAAELAALMALGDPLDRAGLSARAQQAALAGRREAWRPREASVSPQLVRAALAARDATLPVTAIEKYGKCPYQFFAATLLHLSRREEAGLNAMDLGSIRHGALEHLFRSLRGPDGLAWGSLDPAAADRAIDDYLHALARGPKFRRALRAGRMQELALEAAGHELKLTVRTLIAAAARGDFAQIEAEWRFGEADGLIFDVGDGLSVRVRGQVDRIDAAPVPGGPPVYLLFDYKSGQHAFSLASLLAGLDMQLGAYALAWRSRDATQPTRIGGMFYWPLAAPMLDAASGETADAEQIDEAWLRKRKPSGVFAADLADRLDHAVGHGDASPVYRFKRKNDGALGNQSKTHWEAERLEQLLAGERRLIAGTLRAIADGRIAVGPSLVGTQNAACDHCEFAPLCRRDAIPGGVPYRRIAACNRDQAQAQLDAWGVRPEAAP